MSNDIDEHLVRERMMGLTHIEHSNRLPVSMEDKASVFIGNYIGLEEGSNGRPALEPTAEALAYLSYVVSPVNGKNRLLVVARKQFIEDLPEQFIALKPALLEANKVDGEYHLGVIQQIRMSRHMKNKGVLWVAPGATTEQDGLLLYPHTGSIRVAMTNKAVLGIVAMETEGTGETRLVRSLHIDQVPLPEVFMDPKVTDTKNAYYKVNFLIARYALAKTASLLPPSQYGEYHDPVLEMYYSKKALMSMSTDGIFVSGGFLLET